LEPEAVQSSRFKVQGVHLNLKLSGDDPEMNSPKRFFISLTNAIVIANDSLIKERPSLVRAAVAAIIDGIKSWRTRPQTAMDFLKKAYSSSDAETQETYREITRLVRAEPRPDLLGIQNAWDSIPELKARGAVDLRRFVEPKFVDEVLKEHS
jgi:ABC-type nitrate/sulfonate/bicarbonate transport system substrate-binding protein